MYRYIGDGGGEGLNISYFGVYRVTGAEMAVMGKRCATMCVCLVLWCVVCGVCCVVVSLVGTSFSYVVVCGVG